MIVPRLSHDALLADIRAAGQEPEAFHVWWLGQSGFLVHFHRSYLLLDPYLSDSLTRKYAATDKPHVRMTEIPIAPGRLDMVDVVTSSHNHTDHLDGETLTALLKANPDVTVVVPEANLGFAADRLQVPPGRLTTIDAGGSVTAAAFDIHAIPAAHEQLERDDQGRYRYLGYVVRFGPWCLYHSGDTLRYEGQIAWLRQWSIDLALLPINGRRPERRVAGNLWGREAAELARAAGARMVIPCHYDMFTFNTETPEEFVQTARELQQPYRVLQCGERWSSRELA